MGGELSGQGFKLFVFGIRNCDGESIHLLSDTASLFAILIISSTSGQVVRLCAKPLAQRRSVLSFPGRRSTDTRPAPIRDRVWSRPRTVRRPHPTPHRPSASAPFRGRG